MRLKIMNIPESIIDLNPLTFSDSSNAEAAKAMVAFSGMFVSEYGIAAVSLMLANLAGSAYPELSAFIQHTAVAGELAVLTVGSIITLAHGFMAAHP